MFFGNEIFLCKIFLFIVIILLFGIRSLEIILNSIDFFELLEFLNLYIFFDVKCSEILFIILLEFNVFVIFFKFNEKDILFFFRKSFGD